MTTLLTERELKASDPDDADQKRSLLILIALCTSMFSAGFSACQLLHTALWFIYGR